MALEVDTPNHNQNYYGPGHLTTHVRLARQRRTQGMCRHHLHMHTSYEGLPQHLHAPQVPDDVESVLIHVLDSPEAAPLPVRACTNVGTSNSAVGVHEKKGWAIKAHAPQAIPAPIACRARPVLASSTAKHKKRPQPEPRVACEAAPHGSEDFPQGTLVRARHHPQALGVEASAFGAFPWVAVVRELQTIDEVNDMLGETLHNMPTPVPAINVLLAQVGAKVLHAQPRGVVPTLRMPSILIGLKHVAEAGRGELDDDVPVLLKKIGRRASEQVPARGQDGETGALLLLSLRPLHHLLARFQRGVPRFGVMPPPLVRDELWAAIKMRRGPHRLHPCSKRMPLILLMPKPVRKVACDDLTQRATAS